MQLVCMFSISLLIFFYSKLCLPLEDLIYLKRLCLGELLILLEMSPNSLLLLYQPDLDQDQDMG